MQAYEYSYLENTSFHDEQEAVSTLTELGHAGWIAPDVIVVPYTVSVNAHHWRIVPASTPINQVARWDGRIVIRRPWGKG